MSSFRTAESVSPKHPDKICDQISDAILDAYLSEDPNSRVAVDVAGGHGKVFVSGEVSSLAKNVDIFAIIDRLAHGNDAVIAVAEQSPEIAKGVDTGGAGDQGIMVGYACSETQERLPLEVVLSRQLNQYLFYIWPFDGKTQVTLKDNSIHSVVASFQNAPSVELKAAIEKWLAEKSDHNRRAEKQSKNQILINEVAIFANPAGDWSLGGFDADAGLTGRKLIVDNYGPRVPIGGGAFSGKDPSKVDRSAAYMARKVALDYLDRFKANEVMVYLAYAIGYDQPLEATVSVDGKLMQIEGYQLSPRSVVEYLELKQPIYEQTARYGHFGHSHFPWEL